MNNSNNKKRKRDNSCIILDPRRDSAGMAMRSKRAIAVYKKLKTTFDKSNNGKNIKENKLSLQKNDIVFYNEFINSSEAIKQELVYLWEEVGHLNEELDRVEEIINSCDKVKIPVPQSGNSGPSGPSSPSGPSGPFGPFPVNNTEQNEFKIKT